MSKELFSDDYKGKVTNDVRMTKKNQFPIIKNKEKKNEHMDTNKNTKNNNYTDQINKRNVIDETNEEMGGKKDNEKENIKKEWDIQFYTRYQYLMDTSDDNQSDSSLDSEEEDDETNSLKDFIVEDSNADDMLADEEYIPDDDEPTPDEDDADNETDHCSYQTDQEIE